MPSTLPISSSSIRVVESGPGASTSVASHQAKSTIGDVSDAGVPIVHAPGSALNDAEVSRTGVRVSRVDRLGYAPSGRRVWRARRREPG